jgi:hypothetical protein
LVSDIKEGTYIVGVREQGVENNVWAKRDEVTASLRKLHNEELHNLHSFSSKLE